MLSLTSVDSRPAVDGAAGESEHVEAVEDLGDFDAAYFRLSQCVSSGRARADEEQEEGGKEQKKKEQ